MVFGFHGAEIIVTDGKYLYMNAPEHPEAPYYEYTLMPTRMRSRFGCDEFSGMELAEPVQRRVQTGLGHGKRRNRKLLLSVVYHALRVRRGKNPGNRPRRACYCRADIKAYCKTEKGRVPQLWIFDLFLWEFGISAG